MNTFVETYERAANGLEGLKDDIKQMEQDLNDVAYQLYELADEIREYVEETVERPSSPLRPKTMSNP